jgi:hypothetical protein
MTIPAELLRRAEACGLVRDHAYWRLHGHAMAGVVDGLYLEGRWWASTTHHTEAAALERVVSHLEGQRRGEGEGPVGWQKGGITGGWFKGGLHAWEHGRHSRWCDKWGGIHAVHGDVYAAMRAADDALAAQAEKPTPGLVYAPTMAGDAAQEGPKPCVLHAWIPSGECMVCGAFNQDIADAQAAADRLHRHDIPAPVERYAVGYFDCVSRDRDEWELPPGWEPVSLVVLGDRLVWGARRRVT